MSELSSSKSKSADPDSDERAVLILQNCLVPQQANYVLKASKETQGALRRLRQSLLNCEMCTAFEECELREQFNLQVDLVIAETNEEWGW